MIKQTTVYEVNKKLEADSECQVIDVREFSEFDSEHVAAARLMPLSSFERYATDIDPTRPVYLMCRSGKRAKQAAESLAAKGFRDVHVVEGGMDAWSRADLPVVKGESKVWSLERQVRFVAGLIIMSGVALGFALTPYFFLLSGLVGAGLTFAGATDWCGMGMLLARMPWNKAPHDARPNCEA